MTTSITSTTKKKNKKILSIQSHVVHGYVGNKAATFPLQYRGWDVDCLNTVQFSNHPGYGSFSGFKYPSNELTDILQNGLLNFLKLNYSAILTGYYPSPEGFLKISEILEEQYNSNKDNCDMKWILDPVLGDNGKLYVTEGMVEIYKKILTECHIFCCTPNQFEMELLTAGQISTFDDLYKGFIKFHELYPNVKYIVVTNCNIQLLHNNSHDDNIIVACYNTITNKMHYCKTPLIPARFSGSGDLFTALLTDQLLQNNDGVVVNSLHDAVLKSIFLVDQILRNTLDLYIKDNIGSTDNAQPVIKDLKLIQSRHILDIIDPTSPFEAIEYDPMIYF
ncbi:putative pyridoxal kinase BUD17 SCDLUD_001232 [Saccharomycodes ludwigii]|uniref:putative pyridoxal kinase BUD17 n=1 Tax=Saccharomycodes ludwigii TaxID=36035 RepID=UPI001E830860|nr:hypothetical protein SCDLUD_001232 [Saccharomycodes ludwigii]KAH3903588.1 hypothetical protein SCDLUD_001232 [Saccharomycodes ludwigii]